LPDEAAHRRELPRPLLRAPSTPSARSSSRKNEGLEVEWLTSDVPGGAIEQVKRGAIDAQWGGPMRVLKDRDSTPANGASLVCFGEVVCAIRSI